MDPVEEVSKDSLDPNNVYVLDSENGVFVWVGKGKFVGLGTWDYSEPLSTRILARYWMNNAMSLRVIMMNDSPKDFPDKIQIQDLVVLNYGQIGFYF